MFSDEMERKMKEKRYLSFNNHVRWIRDVSYAKRFKNMVNWKECMSIVKNLQAFRSLNEKAGS